MTNKFRLSELTSISILLTGILCLILSLNTGFHDSDYYWHVKLGETIVSTGSIPDEDSFSWIAQEQGFVETAHSWLSSVILYIFSKLFGVYGGGIYAIFTATVFDCILYFLLLHKLQCPLIQHIASAVLAVITYLLFSAARPQNMGYILFAVSIYVLFSTWRKPTFSSVFPLAVLSLLWANLHGGTLPMLFAFELLFCIASIIPVWKFGNLEHTRQSRSCLKVFSGCIAASGVTGLINPYNFSLYYYFFVTNSTAAKQYVQEWQPAMILSAPILTVLMMLFAVFVLFRTKKEFIFVLCACAVVGVAAIHRRVAMYACILIFIMAIFESDKLTCNPKREFPWVVTASVNTLLIAIMTAYVLDGRLWTRFENPVTDEVVQYLADNDISRPFTSYDAGGYFIAKGQQSFIDSRADLFSDAVLHDGMYFSAFAFENIKEYDRCIQQYKFDAIVIYMPTDFKLRNYLLLCDDWKSGYNSADWEIFVPV